MVEATFRAAQVADIEAVTVLIDRSVRGLQANDYSPEQIEAALGSVFGVDRQLIADGTYIVAEVGDALAACGGWSRRRTLFGTHGQEGRDDSLLTPGVDRARIRAFFVSPRFARQGLGAQLLEVCERAAMAEGFYDFELGATLTGVGLYSRAGYEPVERTEAKLPNGMTLGIIRMIKSRPKP